MMIKNEEPTYNSQYAAYFLCVSVRTLQRWRKLGKIRGEPHGMRNICYTQSELSRAFRHKWGVEKMINY